MSNVVLLLPAPSKFLDAQRQIFSEELLNLIDEAHQVFEARIHRLYSNRLERKHRYTDHGVLPVFMRSEECKSKEWRIAPLPARLRCRHIEIGDVSPANVSHFVDALNCDVQSIQVDFDDGHCPTWKNQIQGYHNVIQAVHGKLPGAPCNISSCPILMLRPRAWNIIEHNILVRGKEIPGAILDFLVLMHHCGRKLAEVGSGPFLYLSKVESAYEAKLWNDIFVWTQNKLSIPRGTIKACVLIENILASFEAEEILYEIREHSLGLNCGIWDYIASILVKFGDRSEFVLPDRFKYINVNTPFIRAYLLMVIKTCHMRGAPATGGMVASVLSPGSDGTSEEDSEIISKVIDAKQKEIMAGVDGFLVYDIRMIPALQKLWKTQTGGRPNQICVIPETTVTEEHLLQFPSGGIYLKSLQHNIAVSVLFVYHWLSGNGHFFYKGTIEDSATAEISRSQVWQCIRHQVPLADENKQITYSLVNTLMHEFTTTAYKHMCRSSAERKRLSAAKYICMELFSSFSPPDFITTYLNDSHKFRTVHNKAILSSVKSNL